MKVSTRVNQIWLHLSCKANKENVLKEKQAVKYVTKFVVT